MNHKTADQLNHINQQFYQTVFDSFDSTRQKPWMGWVQLLSHLWQLPQPLKVLDVGCGNGRFGSFLAQHIHEIQYTGVDNSADLLSAARKTFPQGKFQQLDLMNLDELDKLQQSYDCIVLIAVLHHIPGASNRIQLLKKLRQKLNSGGLLLFTAWQFLSIEALKNRVISWDRYSEVDQSQLENNDYLLDWQRGEHAVRYCHLIDRNEIDELISALSLTKVAQYYADGKENKSNIYVVLQK